MFAVEYQQTNVTELPEYREIALYPDRSENLLPDKGYREIFKRGQKSEIRIYGRVCKYEK